MKLHWHLHYTSKTACGILSYPTEIADDYYTVSGGTIKCTGDQDKVTCSSCRRVMLLDRLAEIVY